MLQRYALLQRINKESVFLVLERILLKKSEKKPKLNGRKVTRTFKNFTFYQILLA